MPKADPPASPPAGPATNPDARNGEHPDAPAPATRITPVDDKVGEGRDNLRDRADAFKRRRGTTR